MDNAAVAGQARSLYRQTQWDWVEQPVEADVGPLFGAVWGAGKCCKTEVRPWGMGVSNWEIQGPSRQNLEYGPPER